MSCTHAIGLRTPRCQDAEREGLRTSICGGSKLYLLTIMGISLLDFSLGSSVRGGEVKVMPDGRRWIRWSRVMRSGGHACCRSCSPTSSGGGSGETCGLRVRLLPLARRHGLSCAAGPRVREDYLPFLAQVGEVLHSRLIAPDALCAPGANLSI